MTVEADITTLLRTVADRVFPDVAPLSTSRPYVTYQQIGGEPILPLGREVPDKKNGHFQVNVWADTRVQAAALALAIDSAFRLCQAFQASPLGEPIATSDDEIGVRGTSQDFSVWSAR